MAELKVSYLETIDGQEAQVILAIIETAKGLWAVEIPPQMVAMGCTTEDIGRLKSKLLEFRRRIQGFRKT